MQSKFSEKELKKLLLSYNGQSYSQLKQDVLALLISNFSKSGFFVEFGACDGIHLSNTLLLEELGWNGILAEPSKIYQDNLKKNRRASIDFRAVYSESNKILKFKEVENSVDLSGIEEHLSEDNHKEKRTLGNVYEVQTVSLNDLLIQNKSPKHINFLSIDTEGTEFEIIQNFTFKQFDIDFITIEHNYMDDLRNKIKLNLELNGFQRILPKVSKWDDWYIRKDLLG